MSNVLKMSLVHPNAKVPEYTTDGAAGMDVSAAIDAPIILESLQRAAIPTGIVLEIPDGYEAQLRPRSGLASKHGIGMVNAPATIDADYRGTVHVLLVNLSRQDYKIYPGDRIAQLVIAPVTKVTVMVVDREELTKTARGEGGMGSTGR